jgi:BASS family bile acid:Na+ symporter
MEYADYEYAVAAIELVLAMLGMGATLTVNEFRAIVRRPETIGFILAVQYLFCPLWAWALGTWFGLSTGISLGLVIVAAMPSGALSNVFTYLGRGNLPLSITATCASTLSCLFVTPLVLKYLVAGHLPTEISMPTGVILQQIVYFLLAPLAAGMLVYHYFPNLSRPFAKWCIRGSLVFLAILIVGSLTSGRIDVWEHGFVVPAVLVLFGWLLIGPLQVLCLLLGYNGDDAVTIAIEVTMRNCNVAILLKAVLFPAVAGVTDPIGDGVLYAALFYGGACLGLSAIPVARRRIAEILHRDANPPGELGV